MTFIYQRKNCVTLIQKHYLNWQKQEKLEEGMQWNLYHMISRA